MQECKRCASTEVVKSGKVRGKQRYLCKRCGYHFVEEDGREFQIATIDKALCTIFQALGEGKQRLIGSYLRRDPALIHKWMKKTPIDFQGQWDDGILECPDYEDLCEELKYSIREQNNYELLIGHNVIDDLYIAVIVQKRNKT